MLNINQRLICFILTLSLLACKKTNLITEDFFVEEKEELSDFELEVSSVSTNFIEIGWTNSLSSHFKPITYSIYVNEKKVAEGVKSNKYSLIKLRAEEEYKIKVIALVTDNLKIEKEILAKTLPEKVQTNDGKLYQEYNIHSYSRIGGPIGFIKSNDGGHIFVRHLIHTNDYQNDGFKLLVFRIDKNGNFLWYRIISAIDHGITDNTRNNILLNHNETEAMVFAGSYIFRLNTFTGELITKINLPDLTNHKINTVYHISNQEILLGTNRGLLLSINPETLNANWKQENSENGSIVTIQIDSKKNIYAVFQYGNLQNKIFQYTYQGTFIRNISIDGFFSNGSLIVDENDHVAFIASNPDTYYNEIYYYKFNTSGILTHQKKITGAVSFSKSFINNLGEIIVYGSRNGSGFVNHGGILTFDKDMNLKTKRFYTELNYHGISALTQNNNGSFNLFIGYGQTYSYENFNFVFIRTKTDGSL
ncbi:hypothetical protein PBAC_18700 [Pedobacter glucosidilyticus]|nr:fibronectin type III domain-containing protein [Pedobacter glucosidilyticus]KHJ38005.1 hypothetical protein PBAC_18700 [Pedobacter glucosidilyticus]